jgi:alkanesulfonate monooxygenase SsuD/methylene tetrahydromethanopterin reductase-like flavin-dependent oxidoreductase (luciferase family)
MRPLKIGLALTLIEDIPTGTQIPWAEVRRRALWAEEVGFDTVWIPDELLWEPESWPGPRGWWECVAITAAVAEATSEVTVGTWVLSALHRNPALTAKVVSTLDEISGGRLIFGFGAGHSGSQGRAFGYPEEKIVGRYEEALQVVVPLLRGETVAFEGNYHRASLTNRPNGPRLGELPIMLAGHGPRNIGLAAQYGDMWSAFATSSSQPEAFTGMLRTLDQACERADRDPKSIDRSIGVDLVPGGFVAPEALGVTDPLSGSPDQIAEAVQEFADLGVTNLEFMVWPNEPAALEAAAEVLGQFGG